MPRAESKPVTQRRNKKKGEWRMFTGARGGRGYPRLLHFTGGGGSGGGGALVGYAPGARGGVFLSTRAHQ
ncbi:hypothetical protein MA13_contig00001-0231 [Edwardsiella piscicida]|nr:hypothetical protein QY76_08900 [Edwardsiella sp. EA181011]RFT02313.1 hypothetical protein CGL57_13150 [Edwardsiella anguillarum]GAJ66108.1 hypothetical protein MA13_contig00001-0231 [Edwardsiella piscicida]